MPSSQTDLPISLLRIANIAIEERRYVDKVKDQGFNGLPAGVTFRAVAPAGPNKVTGEKVYQYLFLATHPTRQKRELFNILVTADTSMAWIEESVGNALERWIDEVNQDNRRPPTPAEKKIIGKFIEEYRVARERRKLSSNNKLYYSGLR